MVTGNMPSGALRNRALIAAVALLMLGTASSRARAEEPIVGFWQATWIDASNNTVFANVWDVWHSDHTETQNDSGPIINGFVCQGAWKSLGERTYGLTHPAFNYTAPNGTLDPTMSFLILEKVTVAKDGESFAGTGIFKTLSGIDPYDPHATLLSTLNLNITAKRVTVDPKELP